MIVLQSALSAVADRAGAGATPVINTAVSLAGWVLTTALIGAGIASWDRPNPGFPT